MSFEKINSYLESKDVDSLWDDSEVITWIDWREYDCDIVNYFSDYVGGGETLNGQEDGEYGVNITYKGKISSIPYPNDCADRDTTLIFLNEVIADEYEIKLFIPSEGSDTLGFSILKKTEWQSLEEKFRKGAVDESFRKLIKGTAIFG